jgi:hypothetical protein
VKDGKARSGTAVQGEIALPNLETDVTFDQDLAGVNILPPFQELYYLIRVK